MFDLEDMDGIIRCILWPEQFAEFGHLVRPDAILVVRGAIDRPGGEEANLIVNELIPLDQLDARYTQGVLIRLDERRHEPKMVDSLYEIVRNYPGNCELQLVLSLADGGRVPIKCESLRVELHPELRSRVEQLLGAGSLRPITAPPKPEAARATATAIRVTADNSMKAYLITTGLLFAVLALAHLWWTIEKWPRFAAEPWLILEGPGIGLVAGALCFWAWRLVRR